MKKIKSIIIAFMIICGFANAQTPDWMWAKSAHGYIDEKGNCSATDVFGNVFVSGSFTGSSVVFDGNTLVNNSNDTNRTDIFIAKFASSGDLIWVKGIGGSGSDEARAIKTDLNGNFYLTGKFGSNTSNNPLDFGGVILTNKGLFIVKFDSNGNALWGVDEDSGYLGSYGSAISVDAKNNVYVTGGYSSSDMTLGAHTITSTNSSLPEIFVTKISSTGNVLWLKSAGGNNTDQGFGVTADTSGNVYVSGWALSGGSIAFGDLTTSSGGFLAKYDSVGNELWVRSKQYGYPLYNCVDASGNIYVAGHFTLSSITYGSFTLNNAGTGSTDDLLFIKYNPAGNVIWAKRAGGTKTENINGISIDASKNIYLTGFFYSPTLTVGDTTLTNKDSTGNSKDVFIVKCDSLGNVLWAMSQGGYSNDEAFSVSSDQNGFINLTGYFNSTEINFDSDTLINSSSSGTLADMFIAKLSSSTVYNVWPGDANHDLVVNNNDLLSLGLYYGQTGIPRDSISNLWQGDSAANWGVSQINLADLKHADCNGDGIIDSNDTLAIDLNFNLIHATTVFNVFDNERITAPDIYFVTTDSSYNAGDWVDAEIWLGNSTTPVNNLYGIAFNIGYNSSFVQPGTESITYPVSWLGTPGTDAIKTSKIDEVANTAYGAITRIDHTNASGFGKIADFKFQIKTSIASTSSLDFSISNYIAHNATGASQVFNKINNSINVNAGTIGISEINDISEITISPNPFTLQTTITFTQEQKNTTIRILDLRGKVVKSFDFEGKQLTISKGELKEGVYFVQIIDRYKKVVNRKIIIK